MATRPPRNPLIAVDTNVPLDLADRKEHVLDALDVIRRRLKPGRVLVQTLEPEHYALTHAVSHDFEGFYAKEIAFREDVGYPPFSHLASLTISSIAAAQAENSAQEAASLLRKIKLDCRLRVEILGPVTAPLGKVRGRFRWQILLKGGLRTDLHRILFHFRAGFSHPSPVRLVVDVDPVEML